MKNSCLKNAENLCFPERGSGRKRRPVCPEAGGCAMMADMRRRYYGKRGRYREYRRRRRTVAFVCLLLFFAGAFCVSELPRRFLKRQALPAEPGVFDLSEIPAYSGSPCADVNDGVPFFSKEELTTEAYERYGELDALGRCTAAQACVGPETMPGEEREDVRDIYPTGWHNARYAGIDREYLYNRCHLIGYQLTGENANERNLITGTRSMNVEGMLPLENSVAWYVRETGHHVLYRVTPVFEGSNLVASGVLMEALSVEDPEVMFCVYCYNAQPGVEIDYATGASRGPAL